MTSPDRAPTPETEPRTPSGLANIALTLLSAAHKAHVQLSPSEARAMAPFVTLREAAQDSPASRPIREEVLRWVFALYATVPDRDPRPQVVILGTYDEAAQAIARQYAKYDREHPVSPEPSASPASPLPGLRDALDAHQFAATADPFNGPECSCGWVGVASSTDDGRRNWADHREQAIRAAISAGSGQTAERWTEPESPAGRSEPDR